ncbi:MAG: hypothetical protein HQK50_14430 [Oligoflexia bacterium]|nr:hypothetical protein [Oligoflexia bacterium]MBF0366767.1 hypothetical protein [Oligoflexia bacterium]
MLILKRLNLKTKIVLGFFSMVFLMGILGLLSYVFIKQVSNELFLITKWKVPAVKNAVGVHARAYDSMINQRDYLLHETDEVHERAKKDLTALLVYLEKVDAIGNHYNDQGLLKRSHKVREIAKNYEELFDKGVSEFKKNKVAVKVMIDKGASVSNEAETYLTRQIEDYEAAKAKIKGEKEGSLDEYVQRYILASKIQSLALMIRMKEKEERLHKDRIYYRSMVIELQKLSTYYDELQAITKNEGDLEKIKRARKATNEYAAAAEEWIKNDTLVQQKILPAMNQGAQEAIKLADETEQAGWDSMSSSEINAEAMIKVAVMMIITVALLAIALGIGIGVTLSNFIANPIRLILEQLCGASTQVGQAAGEVSSASQHLSESSCQQAANIEETSSSLEEISSMVENNVKNAEKSTALAVNVRRVSEEGNHSMRELIASMKDILKSNEKIQALVKVISEIGEKTKVIDEIVFQTKLLSFNASVEAERAGEQGRGFAVVAQEIGNLAKMSGQAAMEITKIVKDSIRNAEEITTENKQKVEQGNALVSKTAQILGEITEQAGVVAENAKQILSASKEQASGIKQINGAVVQLDRTTQENAATAEEASSSSEELSAQAETLKDIISGLVRIVHGERALSSVTNTFSSRGMGSLVMPSDFATTKLENYGLSNNNNNNKVISFKRSEKKVQKIRKC